MVELPASLNQWLQEYLTLNMGRNIRLFTEFLPYGYATTTLSCVNQSFYERCQLTKWMIGALITLTDDFTDNPKFRNHAWVKEFIATIQNGNPKSALSAKEQQALKLACQLFEWIEQSIAQMTLQEKLIPFIEFDLHQYFLNMRFSALLNNHPALICKREYIWHSPHNMGVVIAGMIDLACSEHIEWQEMSAMRDIFYCAQRSGHICNTLTTLDRELKEGCESNEIQLRILHGKNGCDDDIIAFLREERADLNQRISNRIIKTFSIENYVKGLQQFQSLHEDMQGVI